MTKFPFALVARFFRNFAGSATRPLLSTEYENLPLNDDTETPIVAIIVDFRGETHPKFPTFPHTGDEIYGITAESQAIFRIFFRRDEMKRWNSPLPNR